MRLDGLRQRRILTEALWLNWMGHDEWAKQALSEVAESLDQGSRNAKQKGKAGKASQSQKGTTEDE